MPGEKVTSLRGLPSEHGATDLDTDSLCNALERLARYHTWTWSPSLRARFDALPGAAPGMHPVQIASQLDDSQLEQLLADATLVAQVSREDSDLSALLAGGSTGPAIAYFSPEFGISDLIPQYSGGLGVLAGDHLKAASDLAVPLCGVGLFYRGGFFRQAVAGGTQAERYETYEPTDLGCVDTGATVTVPVADREVVARVWRLAVGRVQLVLLDTDVEGNAEADRAITDRLYSGDRRHRLEQELVLGVGGARAVRALRWAPSVHHLNEGHAGFLAFELIDREVRTGRALHEAIEAIRPGLVFTTHTPVDAGIDRFDIGLVSDYLAPWADRWGVSVDELIGLGHAPDDDPPVFNMAALCLRLAGRTNGVSQLHGQVSRELFAGVPGGPAIGAITNGVHARSWVAAPLQQTFDEVLGSGWADGDEAAWARVDRIADDQVRAARRSGAEALRAAVAERTGVGIDVDALTVGFARRFAPYKRATLLLLRPELLAALLGDDDRPVQFVFAGKAHPANEAGKRLIADVIAYAATPEANGRFVFVPDYDMALARAMYAGCDVWLNNPVRPHEASGTSGEKAALNGGLNLSISDGWWAEMADGRNGWTIPLSYEPLAHDRDVAEADAALGLLAGEIVPEYYAGGASRSAEWIERMRHGWRTLGPRVTAGRMVSDYVRELYEPARREAGSP